MADAAVLEAPKPAAAAPPTAKAPVTPPQIPPPKPEAPAPAPALSDAELDTAGEEAFSGKPALKGTPKVEPKPDEKPKEEAKAADTAKPDAAKPEEKKVEAAPEIFRGAKEMRQAIEARDTKLATIQSERDLARNELTALKTKLEKGELGGDSKLMAEQLTAKEKELAQVRSKLAEKDYEEGQEFTERFQKPYAQAKALGAKAVGRLTVTLQDGTTRPATAQDWDWLSRKPADQAHEIAKTAFGENYNVAAYHLNRLEEIRDQSEAARAEHRATWEQKSRADMAQAAKERELWSTASKVAREDLIKQNPDWQPSEDADENKVLEQGLNFLDHLEQRMETMTPTERVTTQVESGLKFAAYDRIKLQRDKLKAQVTAIAAEKDAKIAELETRLKEMTDSGPGPSRRQGEAGKAESGWEEMTAEQAGFTQ